MECHARACDFDGAVSALGKAFRALPSQQLQSVDTVKLLVERWVQLQLSVGKSGKAAITTLLPLLNECEMPFQMAASYLEKELSCYHGNRHRKQAHPYVLAATRDLFSLSGQFHSALSCARYAILLASECRLCGPQCQHPSLDIRKTPSQFLAHALKLLGQLLASDKSHPLKIRVQIHQELATAQLWVAITTADQNIRYDNLSNSVVIELLTFPLSSKCRELASAPVGVATGGVAEQEGVELSEQVMRCTSEMCLKEVEEKLMLKRDVLGHLSKAVGAWLDMWQHAAACQNESHGPLDLQEMFHQPLKMLQHMMLTALICSAHSQVSHTHL